MNPADPAEIGLNPREQRHQSPAGLEIMQPFKNRLQLLPGSGARKSSGPLAGWAEEAEQAPGIPTQLHISDMFGKLWSIEKSAKCYRVKNPNCILHHCILSSLLLPLKAIGTLGSPAWSLEKLIPHLQTGSPATLTHTQTKDTEGEGTSCPQNV